MKCSTKLTVFFEESYWVGVFENVEEEKIQVCKVIFGAEPKDVEIYEFVLKEYNSLKFGRWLLIDIEEDKRKNKKRIKREVKKEVKKSGIGTKAQMAIKAEQEAKKVERKIRKFELRQEKKKKKHRGH